MKPIAIHHRPGSFSDRWISYCEEKGISYFTVNAFDNDIVNQIKGCSALMWHHHHGIYTDVIAAKKILFALEHAGITVFPDFKTGWHFDDKVAQKYLLEAIGAPLVPSYVFYDRQKAVSWARNVCYPKVFKLKGGAGASNVRLVGSKDEAMKLIRKAFNKGFSQYDRIEALSDRVKKYKAGLAPFTYLLKGVARLLVRPEFAKLQPNEKGYIYFQDFIPNNDSDIRIVVINGKYAAAERRFVRAGDFRASGSGVFDYADIPVEAVKLAFRIAQRLDLKSVAFDFVKNADGEFLVIEMCYGFGTDGISNVPGYWDQDLNWYEDEFSFQGWMIQCLIESDKSAAVPENYQARSF